MKIKVTMFSISLITSLLFLGVIVFFEVKEWPIGSSIAGIALGFLLPWFIKSFQDLCDTTNWKSSQRKLKREGFIKDETIIRISFAYLYRIKIGTKYLLVKNERGTEKYQPVGGVYKLLGKEKIVLKNLYQVKDDTKISIDKSSRDDYRLRIENKYLRKFVKRFDHKAEREGILNLSREFKEELISKGIINWNKISYRFCGRHMTELHFSEYFQCYELLLADIVELVPTEEQEKDLERLLNQQSDLYHFATADEINTLGINTEKKELKEIIADHSRKIIEENESKLLKVTGVGKEYNVTL